MTSHPPDPKDNGTKIPAATYAWMIPVATRVARHHGYAIAVHGSMGRDLDLVAIPWVETANSPESVVSAIAAMLEGEVVHWGMGPHGQSCANIIFKNAWHFIDIRVMPRIPSNPKNNA